MFKGICALTWMINKIVEQIVPLLVRSELLQEAIDAFALLANDDMTLDLIKGMESYKAGLT